MSTITTSVYRIFLSSTAIDLREHREKASDAILRLGDLPVAMETFGALPNEPVSVCQDKVRQCDARIGILKGFSPRSSGRTPPPAAPPRAAPPRAAMAASPARSKT